MLVNILKEIKTTYNRFKIEKDVKISHNTFYMRVAISIFSIILCLAAMSFSAYAFFTSNVSSGYNNISSATYDLEITKGESVYQTNTKYVFENINDQDLTLSFVISLSPDNTASVGYCKISIEDTNGDIFHYYTKPIGSYLENGEKVDVSSRNIDIIIPPNQTHKIDFVSVWGSCSQTPVEDTILIAD